MTTGNITNFKIGNEEFEVVKDFNYLGAMIEKEGTCEKEIKRRIGMGKTTMKKLEGIMKDSDITTKTKIKLTETLVFPVMMYGCESWTMRKAERRRIDAFELWCWRRVLKIQN